MGLELELLMKLNRSYIWSRLEAGAIAIGVEIYIGD